MKILTIVGGDMKTYSRGRIIYNGLKKNGVNIESYSVKNKFGYLGLIKRLFKRDYDYLIVNGIPVLLIATFLSRKEIILDSFISHYDNLVNDRKLVKKGSFKAKFLRFVDKWSCIIASKVILDTYNHIDYFIEEFKLNENKFHKIPVGADNKIFVPKKKEFKGGFNVVFIGTFIPLQGIEYIIKAAKILEGKGISFSIIGEGQTHKKMLALAEKLKVRGLNFFGNQSLEGLTKFIKESDVCLGIFGKSDKTKRVVPNKVYESIAMKKPVITSETIAISEDFEHKKNIYLCNIADKKSLAKAILELKNNPKLREEIVEGGYKLFKEKFTDEIIGKQIKNILLERTNWGDLE